MKKGRNIISFRVFLVLILLMVIGSPLYYIFLSNKDVTHLLEKRDSLKFKIYSKGKEIQMPPENEIEYNQHIKRWSSSLNTIGKIDINTYAPRITLTSPHLNINFQKDTTIISHRSNSSSAWNQRSRKPNAEDKKLRTFLEKIIQEQVNNEPKAQQD